MSLIVNWRRIPPWIPPESAGIPEFRLIPADPPRNTWIPWIPPGFRGESVGEWKVLTSTPYGPSPSHREVKILWRAWCSGSFFRKCQMKEGIKQCSKACPRPTIRLRIFLTDLSVQNSLLLTRGALLVLDGIDLHWHSLVIPIGWMEPVPRWINLIMLYDFTPLVFIIAQERFPKGDS